MLKGKKATLASLLVDQGFGTRKECRYLIQSGIVKIGYTGDSPIDWKVLDDPEEKPPIVGLLLQVADLIIPYKNPMHIVLHKPQGVECSHASSHYPTVFSLLPNPLQNRKLEAVGRLDADTTGLLLLSDSGDFNHFFTSPKRHVPKTYRVGMKHPITDEQIEHLEQGVLLRGETLLTAPAQFKRLSEKTCELTIHEGKYHQVKRMFAAVSNRVESIHRIAIGGFSLPTTLPIGEWQVLNSPELKLLGFSN